MFPPQPTDRVDKFLEGVLSSLVRGGLELIGDINLDQIENGKFSVMVRIRREMQDESLVPLKNYVKLYAQASGWKLEKARQVRGALLFIVSRA